MKVLKSILVLCAAIYAGIALSATSDCVAGKQERRTGHKGDVYYYDVQGFWLENFEGKEISFHTNTKSCFTKMVECKRVVVESARLVSPRELGIRFYEPRELVLTGGRIDYHLQYRAGVVAKNAVVIKVFADESQKTCNAALESFVAKNVARKQ